MLSMYLYVHALLGPPPLIMATNSSTPHSDTSQLLLPLDVPFHRSMPAMDPSKISLNDSFSYGWTLNKPLLSDSRRSFHTLDAAGSFIEMDPHFFSRRWTNGDVSDDFEFDVPRSSSSRLVLADQIFSDGYLVPCPVPRPTEDAREAASLSGSLGSVPRKDFSARISLTSMLGRSGRRQSAGSCFVSSDPRRSVSSDSSPVFYSAHSTPGATNSSRSRRSRALSGGEKKLRSPLINNYMKSPRKILLKYMYFLIPLYKKVMKGFRITIASGSENRSAVDAASRSSPRTSSAFSSIELCCSNADISISDAILYCKRSNCQYNKSTSKGQNKRCRADEEIMGEQCFA